MAGRRPLAAKEDVCVAAAAAAVLGRGRARGAAVAAGEEALPLVLFGSSAALLFLSPPYSFWIASASAVKLRLALARKTEEALGLASEAARARRAGSRGEEEDGDDDDGGDETEAETFALAIAAVGGMVALLVARDAASADSPAAETGESSKRESAARAAESNAARCRCRGGENIGLANGRRAMVRVERERERASGPTLRGSALFWLWHERIPVLCALCTREEQLRERERERRAGVKLSFFVLVFSSVLE